MASLNLAGAALAGVLLLAPVLTSAQTLPAKKPAPAPAKPAPTVAAKPAPSPAKPAPTTTAAKPAPTPTAAPTTTVAKPAPTATSTTATTAAKPGTTPTSTAAVPATQPINQAVQPAAQRAVMPAPVAASTSTAAGAGTFTQNNVVFSPVGCVHNGDKAVCTFTFVNQGNSGNMNAYYTLPNAQFVDDAHVPHNSDARYYLDAYGTRQGQMFANGGTGGTFVAEFPNVNPQVATGEFHYGDQVVGNVTVGAPGTTPGQGATQAAAAPASGAQPGTPAATTTGSADGAVDKVQQGVSKAQDQKQKAKSLWDSLKSTKN